MVKARPQPVKSAIRTASSTLATLSSDISPSKKRDPQIGTEFKIYRGLKDGVDTNYDSLTDLRRDGAMNPRVDCSYYRYVRSGYKLNYEDNEMPENFILRQTKLELSKTFERHKRKSFQQNVDILAMLECMYLKVLPERPHSDMLRSMREIAKEDNRCIPLRFVPMELDEVQALISILSDPPSRTWNLPDGSTINGRGVDYPTLNKVFTSINKLHADAGVPSPCHLSPLIQRLSSFRSKYEADGATSVDCVSFLNGAWDAVMGMSTWAHLEKLRNWALLLVNWNFMFCPSEHCDFCPLFDEIALPNDDEDWDEDKYPRWVMLLLRNDKKETNISYKMYLLRNYGPALLSSFPFASVAEHRKYTERTDFCKAL